MNGERIANLCDSSPTSNFLSRPKTMKNISQTPTSYLTKPNGIEEKVSLKEFEKLFELIPIKLRQSSNTSPPELDEKNVAENKEREETGVTAIPEKNLSKKEGLQLTNIKISFKDNIFLSKDKFTEVQITSVSSHNEYSVIKAEDSYAFENFHKKLTKLSKNKLSVNPQKFNMYAVQLEEGWVRGTITSTDPLMCFLDDFGFLEQIEDSQIKFCELDELDNVPRFSRSIKIVENLHKKLTKLQIGDKIFVKALSYNPDDSINVQVKENGEKVKTSETFAVPSGRESFKSQDSSDVVKNRLKSLESILDLFKKDSEGVFFLVKNIKPKEWAISLAENNRVDEFDHLFDSFQDTCKKTLVNPNFK